MRSSTRNTVAASLAIAALLVGGCQRGGAASTTGLTTGSSVSSSTGSSATAAPKNLITPENAGKPVLTLKIGEPLTFQKDGVTLVVTAKSLVKLDGAPTDLRDPERTNADGCQAWWALTASIAADVPASTVWKDWAASISGFGALAKGTKGDKYDVLSGDSGVPKSDDDGLSQQIWLLVADWGKHETEHYRKEITGKQYFGGCGVRGNTPTGQEPVAVDFTLGDIRTSGPRDVDVAVWLL